MEAGQLVDNLRYQPYQHSVQYRFDDNESTFCPPVQHYRVRTATTHYMKRFIRPYHTALGINAGTARPAAGVVQQP